MLPSSRGSLQGVANTDDGDSSRASTTSTRRQMRSIRTQQEILATPHLANQLLPGVLTLSLINKELEEVETALTNAEDLNTRIFIMALTVLYMLANWYFTSVRLDSAVQSAVSSEAEAFNAAAGQP